jgi:Rrf2 family protein
MLLTRKACYALIAVKHLAENAERDTSFSAKDLADLYGLPEGTLAKTLQHLAKAGLLQSRHGTEGGYRLADNPGELTVLDVVRASEEAQAPCICHASAPLESDPVLIVHQLLETTLAQLTITGV